MAIYYVLPPVICTALVAATLEFNAPGWPTILFVATWILLSRVLPTYRGAHWLALIWSLVGIALLSLVLVKPGAAVLWGTRIRAETSSALRDVGGIPTPVLCIRVHGQPNGEARALVMATVNGQPVTLAQRTLDLDGHGTATDSLLLPRPGAYAVNVRGNNDRDFIHLTTRVPPVALAARAFSCS